MICTDSCGLVITYVCTFLQVDHTNLKSFSEASISGNKPHIVIAARSSNPSLPQVIAAMRYRHFVSVALMDMALQGNVRTLQRLGVHDWTSKGVVMVFKNKPDHLDDYVKVLVAE